MKIFLVCITSCLLSSEWFSIFQPTKDVSKQLYVKAADQYFDYNQMDSTIFYNNQIFDLNANNLYMGKAYYLNANVFLKIKQPLKAIENGLNAVKYFQIVEDKKREGKSHHLLGNIYYDNYHYEGAVKHYQYAIKSFEAIKDSVNHGLMLRSLGLVLRDSEEYLSANEAFIESLRIFEDLNDKETIATLLNDLGLVELNRKNYPDARNYFERSLDISSSTSLAEIDEAWVHHNLGILNLDKSNFLEAKSHFEKSLRLMKELSMEEYMPGIYNDLAYLSLKENDTLKAEELYGLSKNLSLKFDDSIELMEAASSLKDIYISKSDFKAAFLNIDLIETEIQKRLELTDKLERLNAKYEIVLADSRNELFQIKKEALYNKRVLILSFMVLFTIVAIYGIQMRFKHKKMQLVLSEIDGHIRE